MMTTFEDWAYRILSRDDAWIGFRRLKPAPDGSYTSAVLLQVAAATGLVTAAILYAASWALLHAAAHLHPLADPTTWVPRMAAWLGAVSQILVQAACMWLWNRRVARLHPSATRRARRPAR